MAALGEQVLPRLGRMYEEQLGDRVGHDAVDLLGHRAVEGAQTGLDVGDRQAELDRDQRGRQRGVDIAGDEHDVGTLREQHWLQALHDAGGLLRVRARSDAQTVVGLSDAELLEEDLRHRGVVVLTCVNQHVLELFLASLERADDTARSS